jgi:hypothetical protein
MPQRFEVIFQNGAFRPLGPVPQEVRENGRYVVSMELSSLPAFVEPRPSIPSLDEVRRILAKTLETGAEAVRAEREER